MHIAAAHEEISHPTSVVTTLAQDTRRVERMGPFSYKNRGYGFAPKFKDTSPVEAPISATHTTPMRESIEPRAKEVKKEALMEAINWIEVSDLESKSRGRKGGAAGGGAGRSWALG